MVSTSWGLLWGLNSLMQLQWFEQEHSAVGSVGGCFCLSGLLQILSKLHTENFDSEAEALGKDKGNTVSSSFQWFYFTYLQVHLPLSYHLLVLESRQWVISPTHSLALSLGWFLSPPRYLEKSKETNAQSNLSSIDPTRISATLF